MFDDILGSQKQKKKSTSKLPLGLMPRKLHIERRFQNVSEAIKRYKKAGLGVPDEWFSEYKGLYDYLCNVGSHVVKNRPKIWRN